MRTVPLLVLAMACKGGDKDTAPPIVVDTDTTEDSEAADTFDSSAQQVIPPDRDTGLAAVHNLEGSAAIELGVGLFGAEANVFRWVLKAGGQSTPRCIYAREIIDWEHDPARFGTANPYARYLDQDRYCESCDFVFTVTFGPQVEVERLPWEDEDTDVDTDPPSGDGPLMTCAALREHGGLPSPDPDDTRYAAYGFDRTLGDPGDPGSGALMVLDILLGNWVPLTYDAHVRQGDVTWTYQIGRYDVSYL